MQRKENDHEDLYYRRNEPPRVHATQKAAQNVPIAEHFSTLESLTSLAANRPGGRLIAIWNNIEGNAPVTKFKDRATGVTRIWKAIQTLGETYDSADRASAPEAEFFKVEEAESPAVTPATEPAQETPALEVEATEHVTEGIQEDSQAEVPAGEPEANVGAQTADGAPAEAKATQ